MTVVSNMSPLHYLILINCTPILPLLYGQVFTPPAVIEEMRALNMPNVGTPMDRFTSRMAQNRRARQH